MRDAFGINQSERQRVCSRFYTQRPTSHGSPTDRLFFNPLLIKPIMRTIYLNAGRMAHFGSTGSHILDEQMRS